MKRLVWLLLLGSSTYLYAQESMLCRGHYWTEDEGNLKMKEFAGMWDDRASWEKRAATVKKGIIEGMRLDRMPDVEGDFNPIIRNTRQLDGYLVENTAIESFPGFYITGNLYRPPDSGDKHAAILCPHGHWEDRRMSREVQVRCAVLARMGAIVFAFDMPGYGESRQVPHRIPAAMLLQTWNCKRVLEYLLSRDDVDPQRIGMTGASCGSFQTIILTAIDDRIRVSVPVVQVSAHFFGGCICQNGMPIYKSNAHQTNNAEIAALCAPRPMLLISDGMDHTRNMPRVEYPYIRRVYALYDAEHRLEHVHFPAEKHDYGYSKRAVAYIFLAYHLKLDTDKIPINGTVNEDFVTVLAKEDLKVFTDDNPIPDHAITGQEAVMDYLGFEQ
jgi:hypothetical protein